MRGSTLNFPGYILISRTPLQAFLGMDQLLIQPIKGLVLHGNSLVVGFVIKLSTKLFRAIRCLIEVGDTLDRCLHSSQRE
jgi:hypothetical protein